MAKITRVSDQAFSNATRFWFANFFTVIFLTFSPESIASPPAPVASQEPAPKNNYWTIGLGYAFSHYPTDVERSIDPLKQNGASHFPLAYDLGYYWPSIDEQSIVGVSLHGSHTSYHFDDYNYLSIEQSGVSASYLHFFGPEIGTGFFARGDLGLSLLFYSVDGSSATSSNTGLGINVGGGYGIQLLKTVPFLFMGTYSYRHVNNGNYTDFTFTIGPLF